MSWRAKKLRLPKGMKEFPRLAINLTASQLPIFYKEFSGIRIDPEAKEELMESQAVPDGDVIAMSTGMAESGRDKLSIPFVYAWNQYPKLWPGLPQETGNCVGKMTKNATLCLYGVEVALGQPDEETGEIEGWIDVPLDLQPHGIFEWETKYGMRGHAGQGASCSRLILVLTKSSGVIVRKAYPEVGVDFTKEDTNLSIKWGRRGVPENILALGKSHPIRNAADVPDHEVARDFIANGYPIGVCSDLGFSDQCDPNGFSRRQGSWGHSWIVAGYDDRPETKKLYGFPLFLFIHDWGLWNSNKNGILIRDTNIKIPAGSFWADARLLDQCDMTALSGLRGWKRQVLPDYGSLAWG